MRSILPALGLLLLVSCGPYPVDTENTIGRVRGGEFRIGWIAGSEADPHLPILLANLSRSMRARPHVERGASERLLTRLEKGELDLVVGHFDRKSPWSRRVTLSRPLAKHGRAGAIETRAAVRLGEHRWAMTVEQAIARLPAEARP